MATNEWNFLQHFLIDFRVINKFQNRSQNKHFLTLDGKNHWTSRLISFLFCKHFHFLSVFDFNKKKISSSILTVSNDIQFVYLLIFKWYFQYLQLRIIFFSSPSSYASCFYVSRASLTERKNMTIAIAEDTVNMMQWITKSKCQTSDINEFIRESKFLFEIFIRMQYSDTPSCHWPNLSN